MSSYTGCESCIFNHKVNSLKGDPETVAALQEGFKRGTKGCPGYKAMDLRYASRISLLHQASYSFTLEPRYYDRPAEPDVTRVTCNNPFKYSDGFKEIMSRFNVVEIPPEASPISSSTVHQD